jgi:hypothetical protein
MENHLSHERTRKTNHISAVKLPILKTELPADAGRLLLLVQRLFVARARMAPHQKERDNGKLILECCEVMGGAVLSIEHIEACLEDGARIVKQDGKWWLFAKDGNGIKGRERLVDLLLDLPPLNDRTLATQPAPQDSASK